MNLILSTWRDTPLAERICIPAALLFFFFAAGVLL
jgi:hypothetical protein